MRTHELVQLKSLPLFSEMKAESLDSLLDAALLQQFPPGVVLIHEGEPADFLHVLVDGLVEIFTEQAGGEWGISLINPVSTFILAAVVSDQPYLNSARTLADSRVLLIPAQTRPRNFRSGCRICAHRGAGTCARLSIVGQEAEGLYGPIKCRAPCQLDPD